MKPKWPREGWHDDEAEIPKEIEIPPDVKQLFHPDSSWDTKDLLFLRRYGAALSFFLFLIAINLI